MTGILRLGKAECTCCGAGSAGDGYIVEKLEIDSIPAYLVVPEGLGGRAPAILNLHYHSGGKDGPLFAGCSPSRRVSLTHLG